MLTRALLGAWTTASARLTSASRSRALVCSAWASSAAMSSARVPALSRSRLARAWSSSAAASATSSGRLPCVTRSKWPARPPPGPAPVEVGACHVDLGLRGAVAAQQCLVAAEVLLGELEVGLGALPVALGLADLLLAEALLQPGVPRLGGGGLGGGGGDLLAPGSIPRLLQRGQVGPQLGPPLCSLGLQLGHLQGHQRRPRLDAIPLEDVDPAHPAADLRSQPDLLHLDHPGQDQGRRLASRAREPGAGPPGIPSSPPPRVRSPRSRTGRAVGPSPAVAGRSPREPRHPS